MNPSPYMTLAEAAEMLRLSEGTLRNKLARGELREGVHYFRPPGMRPRFKRSALERWIEGEDAGISPPGIRMPGGYLLGSGGNST